jgi:hypothetical protein
MADHISEAGGSLAAARFAFVGQRHLDTEEIDDAALLLWC